MKQAGSGMLAVALVCAVLVATGRAHSQIGTALKKKHRLRSVTCIACHPREEKTKKRDVLTPFAETLAKLLEGKQISQRIEDLKGTSKEERAKGWAEINIDLQEALEKLDTMKAPSGKTYAEAIPLGEVDGTRIRR